MHICEFLLLTHRERVFEIAGVCLGAAYATEKEDAGGAGYFQQAIILTLSRVSCPCKTAKEKGLRRV